METINYLNSSNGFDKGTISITKKKKILVCGAYGLVGSNICKILEREHPEISITKIKCDEIYNDAGDPYLGYFDYIIHTAGYGQPSMFGKDKARTIGINTTLTNDLFKCMAKGGKFLFVSTSEVYSGSRPPHRETDIGTTTPQHPRACYIEGKRCGEAICMAFREQGYDVKIVRLALAYGPGTKKGDTRVLNQFIEEGLMDGNIKVKSNGNLLRRYIYVDDAASLVIRILFDGRDIVYNVGGDESAMTINGIAMLVAGQIGCSHSWNTSDIDASAPDAVSLDMSRTLAEFPMDMIPFREGLKRTVEYQKQLYGID